MVEPLDKSKEFREGVRAVIKEMKLREFLDGEFYVLKKEKVDYLIKLYGEIEND